MATSSSTNTSSRLGTLETSISTLATQFGDFIKESQAHRDRIERDQTKIWDAVKDQGERFNTAVDRLSTRGALSWPVIVVTVGMILSIIGFLGFLAEKIADARLETHQVRAEFTLEMLHQTQVRLDRIEQVQDAAAR